VIQKTTTSVVVFIIFPQHKAVVAFDPIFSWTKSKAPLQASQLSEEFVKVSTESCFKFLILSSELLRTLQQKCRQKFKEARPLQVAAIKRRDSARASTLQKAQRQRQM
jgi:hypothetical protein